MGKVVIGKFRWSATLTLEDVERGKLPNTTDMEVIDAGTRRVSILKLGPGTVVEGVKAGYMSCLVELRGGYCLNPVTDQSGMCSVCRAAIPSPRCLMGEPWCPSREKAPRKCITYGVYSTYCTVPRMHYILIYLHRGRIYLKVGVARSHRAVDRILEQAPPAAIVYAETPDTWIGRQMEVATVKALQEVAGKKVAGYTLEKAVERKRDVDMLLETAKAASTYTFIGTTPLEELSEKLDEITKQIHKTLQEKLPQHLRKHLLEKPKTLNLTHLFKDIRNLEKLPQTTELPTHFKLKVQRALGGFIIAQINNTTTLVRIKKTLIAQTLQQLKVKT